MKDKGGFLLGIFVLVSICVFIIFYFVVFNKTTFCGDGTEEGWCSSIQPYYCLKGKLIEKASLCGCTNNYNINVEKCNSPYKNGSRLIFLNYTLRGKQNTINFTVYKGLYDYILEIPRYIDSDENPTLRELRLKLIDESYQKDLLLPLVIEIQNLAKTKEDQARIAISLVQNIPFGNSNKTFRIGNAFLEYQRYPYEVLYDLEGICSEKSALLVFLLKEIGYDSAFLYYNSENHEAVGVKCPEEESVYNSSYCFVETTGPSIITDDKTDYIGITSLKSIPEVISISEGGLSLGENIYEYEDADNLIKIRENYKDIGSMSVFEYLKFKQLKKKYGLVSFSYSGV